MKSRVQQLDPEARERYWHLCPDFVIELRSPTDRARTVREKMQEWIANGAQMAWLVEPAERSVTIFRPDLEPATVTGVDAIAGEGPVEGFVLALPLIWDPLAG